MYLHCTYNHGLHCTRDPSILKWQTVTTRSTMESELIALDKYGDKAAWL